VIHFSALVESILVLSIEDMHDVITFFRPHILIVSLHWWNHWKCIAFRDSKLYFKLQLVLYDRNTYATTGMKTIQNV